MSIGPGRNLVIMRFLFIVISMLKDIYYFFYRLWHNQIKTIPREIAYFCQRGWRGYSDRDCWGIDGFLMEILPPMIRKIKDNIHGCPVEFAGEDNKHDTVEDGCIKWAAVLEKMAAGFDAAKKMDDAEYLDKVPLKEGEKPSGHMGKIWPDVDFKYVINEEKRKLLEQQQEEGLDLFRKYFFNLWD